MERIKIKGGKIAELVKLWKIIGELDDDDRKDLVIANLQNFNSEVKELTPEEHEKLLTIICSEEN